MGLAIILRSFSFSLPSVLTSFMSALLRRFSIFCQRQSCSSVCKSLFYKCGLGFFAHFCIETDIWFRPWFFFKLQNTVNSFELHTKRQVKHEILVVENVFIFFNEIRDKFCYVYHTFVYQQFGLIL